MSLVTPDLGLLFWTFIVFIILVIILRRVAWRPIIDGLKIREESIQNSLDEAKKAREEISSLKADNEKLLAEARKEREKIITEARTVANQLKEEARAEASKQKEGMIEEAKAEINTAKQAALADVKNQVAALSIEIAEKLLKKNLADDNSQKELVDGLVKDLNLN